MKKKNARVAMQLGRSDANKQQLQKKSKKSQKAALERPWATPQFEELSKEDRDIVLDRIQKEIADVVPTITTATKAADAPVVRPAPAFQSFIVRGVNQVARLIARSELRVVVFANNPESLVFAHIPLLCRLHRVPICVLHLSSKTFGKLFGINSLVVLGIKKLPVAISTTADASGSGEGEAPATADANAEPALVPGALSELERSQLASISEFLISKASKKNNNL
ncbi:tRNA dimethylallyltransferase [Globisporangium polare]